MNTDCIHHFKMIKFHHIDKSENEDATKTHKVHIPFSWIKFHHIDKSVNEDATKTHKVHIPFSWIKFHHIDKSENEDAAKNRKFHHIDKSENNAKTTPCQYCNNIFDRKSDFTLHIEQNISESKWTGPLL